MVLGRTHVKEVATKRKMELNNYVHNLLRSSSEVTEVCTHMQTHTVLTAVDDVPLALCSVTSSIPSIIQLLEMIRLKV